MYLVFDVFEKDLHFNEDEVQSILAAPTLQTMNYNNLSNIRMIMKALKGKLKVSSKEDGTKFSL